MGQRSTHYYTLFEMQIILPTLRVSREPKIMAKFLRSLSFKSETKWDDFLLAALKVQQRQSKYCYSCRNTKCNSDDSEFYLFSLGISK